MAETKKKSDIGEIMITADLLQEGHKVVMPVREDWKYDFIGLINGVFQRIQYRYIESNGKVIRVTCRSSATNATRTIK